MYFQQLPGQVPPVYDEYGEEMVIDRQPWPGSITQDSAKWMLSAFINAYYDQLMIVLKRRFKKKKQHEWHSDNCHRYVCF